MDQAYNLRNQINSNTPMPKNKNSRVIAVSSGKGGVGKSNITLNIAIELVKRGQRVVIFDADFGLANIEILAGVTPKYSFADVMNGRQIIQEIIVKCPSGVDLISGGSGIVDFIKSGNAKINFIMDNFSVLDKMYDIILIDTGAGASENVLNFIRASHETIIVTTPEPTSLTDAYALLKSLKYVSGEIPLPKFYLIINRVDDIKEGNEVCGKLQSVSTNFLKTDLELLGFVPFDPILIRAVRKQEAVTIYAPKSPFSRAIDRITQKLVDESVNVKSNSGISIFMKRLVNIFNG